MNFSTALNKILPVSAIVALACSLMVFAGLFLLSVVNPLGIARELDFWAAPLVLIFSLWYLKMQRSLRNLHLWEGLGFGYILATFHALLLGCSIALVLNIYPDILANYKFQEISHLELLKIKAVKDFGITGFNRQMEGLKATSVSNIFLDVVTKKLIYGIIYIPIIAIVMRKRVIA